MALNLGLLQATLSDNFLFGKRPGKEGEGSRGRACHYVLIFYLNVLNSSYDRMYL